MSRPAPWFPTREAFNRRPHLRIYRGHVFTWYGYQYLQHILKTHLLDYVPTKLWVAFLRKPENGAKQRRPRSGAGSPGWTSRWRLRGTGAFTAQLPSASALPGLPGEAEACGAWI